MFTGIIETMANVLKNENGHLVLERPKIFDDINIGSSICVSGVCLTVAALDSTTMSFDVVSETLARTKLGELMEENRAGLGEVDRRSRVNLERALKADGRFEGHVVQGHIEDTGAVLKYQIPNSNLLTIVVPKHLLPFIVEKGSIAIDGVSLTVAQLKGNECTIALIPHTLKVTTLGLLKKGDSVNIETDILGRYIRQCS